jgi:hypothetical protein
VLLSVEAPQNRNISAGFSSNTLVIGGLALRLLQGSPMPRHRERRFSFLLAGSIVVLHACATAPTVTPILRSHGGGDSDSGGALYVKEFRRFKSALENYTGQLDFRFLTIATVSGLVYGALMWWMNERKYRKNLGSNA